MTSLGFAAPLFLLTLMALPAIWWLLRLTPPRQQTEIFPPLKLLLRLARKDETPSRRPSWWLMLLRLLVAALVILALARPVWKPQADITAANRPLTLIIDNGWTAAADWKMRLREARTLVDAAENGNAPIYIIATAEEANAETGPWTGKTARKRLDSLLPRAIPADRKEAFTRLAGIARTTSGLQAAYLTDGLATPADSEAFSLLQGADISPFLWYQGDISSLTALNSAENTADKLTLTGVRASTDRAGTWQVTAHDLEGRRLGEAQHGVCRR